MQRWSGGGLALPWRGLGGGDDEEDEGEEGHFHSVC